MTWQASLPGISAEIDPNARDAWGTPEWVWRLPLEAIGRALYDVDPCSNERSTVPAVIQVCPPFDGLAYLDLLAKNRHSHEGVIGWLNPPYSDVEPWFRRAHTLSRKGQMWFGVVPHAPHIQAWRHYGPDLAWSLGRVRFVPPPGVAESSPTQEHDLVLWRPPDWAMTGACEDAVLSLDVHPSCLYAITRSSYCRTDARRHDGE